MWRFLSKLERERARKLPKSILKSTLVALAAALLTLAAAGQESNVGPVLQPAPEVQATTLAPNFRVAAFRLETLDNDNAGIAPDPAPDSSSADSGQQEGLLKRSLTRIGGDQKRLYLAPFKPHNFKWDAVVLLGTGTLLVFDRRIENNVPNSHFKLYQDTSDAAIGGLAGSLLGVWLYGIKTEHRHARETGTLALETLVNAFLIYTPMQLVFGRQRPGEGNGQGDFFKHHAIDTSFPGGHAMFTWAMASVLADEYPKTWARVLSYGAAFTVTFTRFMARDHWASDMWIGTGLGLGIAENTFHSHCNPEFESQCKHHQWWWKAVKVGIQ